MPTFTLSDKDFSAFANGVEFAKQMHSQQQHGEVEINGIKIEWDETSEFKITIEEE